MILVDTSGLLAALFPGQRRHESCAAVLRQEPGPFLLSPFVLAEVDCLLIRYADVDARLAFFDEVSRGAYLLEEFDAEDVRDARELIHRHREIDLGLTDASINVLAVRHRTHDILTLDERRFGALPGPRGRGFRLLPRDA